MHDYLFSVEIVRFAFVFGVVVSMLMYERFHITTGSIVVPGYIGVFMIAPTVLFATFLNAILTYAFMNHVLRRRFMLFGRSKFTVMALTAIGIQTVMLKLSPSGPWLWESDFPLFVGAGYVVPALIAHDMGRQGIKHTVRSVMTAGLIVAVPILLALIFDVGGANDLAPLGGFAETAIDSSWVPIAVLLSAAASWAVGTNYRLRCGGFVGAAYIGMFMRDPFQVAAFFFIAIVTFVIVRFVLMRVLILFGRRKFSAMLLTSSLISWTLLWTGASVFSARVTNHLDLASLALTSLFVPGLLANDMERSSPLRVVFGSAFAGSFVVPATWWLQSAFTDHEISPLWKMVALCTGFFLFEPSIDRWLKARAAAAAAAVNGRLPLRARVWAAIAP
jgi:poly-gamma-glutamate biosynthesis protein PgsC/CapC